MMRQMIQWLAVLVLAVLTACAGQTGGTGFTGAQGVPGPQGAAAPTPTPNPTPDPIQAEAQIVNAQRVAQGQDPLTQGLSCALYNVPTTTTQIVGATLSGVGSFTYLGVINQLNSAVTTGLNILPTTLQSVFQTWFVLKCTGTLIMPNDAWHSFSLTSDDGSNLYVDGLLINNDGLHSAKTVSNIKFLAHGAHSFELDFLQAAGSQALILDMDSTLLPAENMFH